MSTCTTCGASIVWATTVAGKAMPLDALPIPPEGAILAARRVGPDLEVRHITTSLELWPDEHPARSHYATCPSAAEHRRPR